MFPSRVLITASFTRYSLMTQDCL